MAMAAISSEALDWQDSVTRLQEAVRGVGVAELHGLLCGNTCAGGGVDDRSWLKRISEHASAEAVSPEAAEELMTFRNRALVNLGDADFSFDLLLPPQGVELSERLQSLADWCAGFLAGYGLAGGPAEIVDEDAQAGLRDLAAISALDAESSDEPDAETDFAELVEYVRVVVMLLLQQRPGAGA